MDGTKLTKEKFLKNVENHSMHVLKDDGLYRHVTFSNEGSSNQRFEIVTWPGYLSIVGDMGDFIFQRTEDMFSFFRNREGTLEINPGYWAEKVVAEGVFSGIKEFSVEKFREEVISTAEGYFLLAENEELSEEVLDELDFLLSCEDEYECVSEMRNFHWDEHPDLFVDFFESNLTRGTYHYIWCCYAVVWAVMVYDKYKTEVEQNE